MVGVEAGVPPVHVRGVYIPWVHLPCPAPVLVSSPAHAEGSDSGLLACPRELTMLRDGCVWPSPMTLLLAGTWHPVVFSINPPQGGLAISAEGSCLV